MAATNFDILPINNVDDVDVVDIVDVDDVDDVDEVDDIDVDVDDVDDDSFIQLTNEWIQVCADNRIVGENSIFDELYSIPRDTVHSLELLEKVIEAVEVIKISNPYTLREIYRLNSLHAISISLVIKDGIMTKELLFKSLKIGVIILKIIGELEAESN